MCFGDGSTHKKEEIWVGDDKTIYVEIAATPLKNATGEVIGSVEVSRDITERKRAEEDLKESGQLLQSIIHGYPVPAFVIGKDHQVIYWNKPLEVMSQVKANEAIGTNLHSRAFYSTARPCMADLLLDEATPEAISHWYNGKIYNKSSLLEEAYEATEFFPEIGAVGRWLHFTAAPIRDSQGNIAGAIETLEDITERKWAEEALKESQQQLADIIDFLPDATFVIDREGKVIAWNRAVEEMLGIRAADMLGKGDYEYALPFYGERRPILIDLVFEPREEFEAKYENVKRKGGVLTAEAYIPASGDGEKYLLGAASAR